jgi:Permeases of the drug/metabolite transporter (DMT) superfamily
MRDTQLSGRDFLAAACIIVIWGTNFVAMKIGLRSFTPFQLGAARYLFGMLPLVLLVRAPRLPWKWVVLYGLCQGVGQFGLLFVSLRVGMTAALASVLMQTQMFFTALFSFLLLAEKPGKPLLAGMALAALGLGCFGMTYITPEAGAEAATTVVGFALCLGAASMWAASNIVVRLAQRSAPEFSPLGFLAWCSAVPVLPFVVASLLFDDPATRWRWSAAPWEGWLSAAYLGWVATIAAYSMWTNLIKRHGPNRIAPFSLGVPVIGLASGIVLLGERVTPWQWGGIVLTVLALACVVLGGRWAAARRA